MMSLLQTPQVRGRELAQADIDDVDSRVCCSLRNDAGFTHARRTPTHEAMANVVAENNVQE